jgi:photosystem II stability/assembly factor-like uncharacterized protein
MVKKSSVLAALVLALGVAGCRPAADVPVDGGAGGGSGGGAGGGSGGGTGGGSGGNRAPTWGSLEAVLVNEGEVATVNLSATDEDGDTVTFEVTAGAPFAVLTGSQLVLSPAQTDAADYILSLAASDGKSTTPAELVVVVNGVNVAPVLDAIPDVTVAPGATATVTVVATDPDNNPLTLTPSGLPTFGVLSGDTFTFAPDPSILGVFPVSLSVSDGTLSATRTFQVKVEQPQLPNAAPTVTAVQQLGLGSAPLSAGASLAVPPSLTATVTDPEGDEVALEAEVVTVGQAYTGTPTLVGTQAPLAAIAPLPVGALTPGNYAWRLRARDAAGNASDWMDYTPGGTSFTLLQPAGTATGTVAINAGAAFTNAATVTLAITQTAGTIAQMAFSADGDFASATFVPFAPTASFTLPSGDGSKSIYARFKDGAGGTSDAVDTIVLDTTDPTGTVTVSGGAAYTNTAAVSVAVSPVEGGSGLAGMCVKQYAESTSVFLPPALNDPCYVAFSTPVSVTLTTEGPRRVMVWLKDAAGNSKAVSSTIHYDATAPGMPGKFTAKGKVRKISYGYDRPAESGSGLSHYELEWCFGIVSCAGVSPQVVTGIPLTALGAVLGDSYQLAVPNGRMVTARVTAVDLAGNRSTATNWVTAYAHWPFEVTQRAPSANAFNAVGYNASATRYFLAGNKGELYTSSDGLATFTRVDPLSDQDVLAVDATSGYVWLAGRNGYIGRSDDQGSTFAAQSFSTQVTADLHGIGYVGTNASGGALGTTRYAYVAVGEGGTLVRSVRTCISAALCGLAFPGAFTPVTSGVTADLNAVARCAGGPTHCAGTGVALAVGANGTILRTTDAGGTWTQVSAPAGYDTATFNAVVQVPGTDRVYVGGTKPSGRPALIVSTAGGTVWDAVTAPNFDDFTEITALSAQPKPSSGSSNTVLVAGKTGTTYTVSHLVISSSARTNATVTSAPAGIVSTAFAAGAWVGAEGAVQKSSGILTPSWSSVSSGSDAAFKDARFADGSADAALAVGSGGRIYLSTNQGTTWTSVAPASATAVNFNATWFDGSAAVAVGDGAAIYRGSNGGNTWGTQSASGTFTADLNGVSCRSSTACIAVGDKESILTYSGGSTWTITSTAASSTNNYLAVTAYLSGSTPRAVAVGTGGKVEILNNTTWSKPTSGVTAGLQAVAARKTADGVVVAVGGSSSGGTISITLPAAIRSTDHGATWSAVTLSGVSGLLTGVTHVDGNAWLASSSNGTVYLSTDDGVSFGALVTISDGLLKSGGLSGIHCSNKAMGRETCLASGRAGGIYVTTSAGQ